MDIYLLIIKVKAEKPYYIQWPVILCQTYTDVFHYTAGQWMSELCLPRTSEEGQGKVLKSKTSKQ